MFLVNFTMRCCHQREKLVHSRKPQKAKDAHDAEDTFTLPSKCLHVVE